MSKHIRHKVINGTCYVYEREVKETYKGRCDEHNHKKPAKDP